MPPRPFRQSLSIGTDICHYPRFSKYFPIHQHLASTTTAISSQSLLFKLFDKALVPAEQRAFWRRFQPSSSTSKSSPNSVVDGTEQQIFWTEKKAEEAAKFLGGRWAAKEATIKAFTAQRRLVLRDVRVWSVGQGKQPLALVVDEVEGGVKKYDSAKEIYERFLLQRRLGEELKLLQQGKQKKNVLPSSGGLRIIKTPILSRHTARSMEMKKMAPSQQETETSTNPPPILSKTGILDFNAVTEILNQGEETSTSIPATQTPQAEPQGQQQKLEEEIDRLNREELEEDGWDNMQGQIVKVSISHDGEYCVATALAAV
jgi:phosphopantetheinyl transferase (holo-ACP synthase)